MPATDISLITPVILSGGSGTRLWPVSTSERPKQFHPIFSLKSMMAATIARVQDKTVFQAPVVISGTHHLQLIKQTLGPIVAQELIFEPFGRNTAAAVAIAALQIAARAPQALMLVLASDHAIQRQDRFMEDIRRAALLATEKRIVTFGIRPDRAHTGYGYIERDRSQHGPNYYAIKRFIEKPELLVAQAMVDSGNYLWNSGIFMFRADHILNEYDRYAPELLAACRTTLAASHKQDGDLLLDHENYGKVPAIAFDVAIMEKTDIGIVQTATFDWSDVGCWSAVHEISDKDLLGNAVTGKCILAGGTSDSLIRNNTDIPLYVTGIDNLVVVVTPDGIVISAKSLTQDIRNAASSFKISS